jgi:membrane protease YdiL (CAAX protease family)
LVWIFSYTRTLWACIALHALFNGVAVLSWAFV